MTTISFLRKLNREGKLSIVEPSDNIKESYLQKSENYLASAKSLLEDKFYEQSISMTYYSMYYSLLALLFKTGIKSENHTASILLLKIIYNIDNTKISFAKTERIDKQYYVDFTVTKQQTKELIEQATIFNQELYDFINRLNTKSIEETIIKLKSLLKK